MSKMIGVGKITDAGTAKRITDIFEHVKGRGPEVSAKMAESWSVEVSNTGMPGKPVNPAFSAAGPHRGVAETGTAMIRPDPKFPTEATDPNRDGGRNVRSGLADVREIA